MHKILFVNSDPKLTGIYLPPLRQHFSIDSASDGLSALRKFRRFEPSVIISDYHLPLLSGLALLRAVRSHPKLAQIPFLFFSSSGGSAEALGAGANEWLPAGSITPDLMVEKIYNHLKLCISRQS